MRNGYAIDMNTQTVIATATYMLPELRYDFGDLAPVVSAQTMELHHGTHHAGYVKMANELSEKLEALGADEDPSALERSLSFNLGAHKLHSLLWTSMCPSGSAASTSLATEINRCFGSLDALCSRLSNTVGKLAGSGWGVLSWEPVGRRLQVSQLHDHQNDHLIDTTPLLVIDGWEHAYYLQYHADRAGWAKSFFEVADWQSASIRFQSALD